MGKKNKKQLFKFSTITKAIISSLLSLIFSFLLYMYYGLEGDITKIFIFFGVYSFSYIFFYEMALKRYLTKDKFTRFFMMSLYMVGLYAILYLVIFLILSFEFKMDFNVLIFYFATLFMTAVYTFSNVYIKELFFKKKKIVFSIIFSISGFIFGLAIGGFINVSILFCIFLEYLINKKRVK